MEDEREVLSLEPIADEPEVGRWLSAMEDARRDTLRELDTVSENMLDWRPEPAANSIWALLYHIALVEADWLITDIFGPEEPIPWPQDLLPYPDRDEHDRLIQVEGTIPEHLERLASIRTLFLDHVRPMSIEDFHRIRRRERYDVTAAWTLHHLLQHEAEHRAHIAALREAHR